MSFCPLDSQTGFIQLTGPISQELVTQIQANSAPFTASFSPRQNKPRLDAQASFIEEGTNNTIVYNSIRYQLANVVQICKPTHTGYTLPGVNRPQAEMELVLTFVNMQAGGSYPTGILVIVPIYAGELATSQRADYIRQFLGDAYPTATLQSLFVKGDVADPDMKAFSYITCVDILDGQNRKKTYLRCFYFSRGMELAPREYATFKSMITANGSAPLKSFRLLPVLRYDTGKTVLAYTVGNRGVKIPTETSATGAVAESQLSTASAPFRTKMQFFTKIVRISGSSGGEDTCPYYPTSKYKCVPFNALRDLSGNQVIPGGMTLDKVISSQDAAKAMVLPPAPNVSNVTKWLGIATGIVAGLVAIAGLVYLVKWMGRPTGASVTGTQLRGTAEQIAKVGAVTIAKPVPSVPASAPSAPSAP
jgi:hypothetical protein